MSKENSINFDHHEVSNNLFIETWESVNSNRVVVSVPHDVKPNYTWPDDTRKRGVIHGDPGAWLIAKDLMFESYGQTRYKIQDEISVVRSTIPRGVVDLNRSWPEERSYYNNEPPQTALENLRYANVYKNYYSELFRLLNRGIESYDEENILMIDLHGFGSQPKYAPEGGYDLILGTGNRKTIFYDDIDLKMGRFFSELGYKVFVPADKAGEDRLEDVYSAEHITRSFAELLKINVIQIEVAKKFRDKKEGRHIGPKLSRDILEFLSNLF